MIRLDAIPTIADSRRGYRPFTSAISAAALVGLYIGLLSKFIVAF